MMMVSAAVARFRGPNAEVGGGAGGINAICGRPEVADDVVFSEM